MKNKTIKTFSLLLVAITFLGIQSCKKKTEDTPSDTPKTLNKALLVGKKWYNQSGSVVHDIRTGGVYSSGGTWEWKNNSDTMIIDLDGPSPTIQAVEWKFFWSAEKEMACKMAGSGSGEILFKDQAW